MRVPPARPARVARALAFAAVTLVSSLACAQQAVLQTPEPTETQKIETLLRDRDYAAALTRVDALLKTSPRNAQARFLRAVILADTGKTAEARSALESMTHDFPELPEPYNNLAVMQAAAGRYDNARALLLRALEVTPDYLTAQENLGDLYLAMGADVYARALALDPDNAALKAKLQVTRDASARLRSAR